MYRNRNKRSGNRNWKIGSGAARFVSRDPNCHCHWRRLYCLLCQLLPVTKKNKKRKCVNYCTIVLFYYYSCEIEDCVETHSSLQAVRVTISFARIQLTAAVHHRVIFETKAVWTHQQESSGLSKTLTRYFDITLEHHWALLAVLQKNWVYARSCARCPSPTFVRAPSKRTRAARFACFCFVSSWFVGPCRAYETNRTHASTTHSLFYMGEGSTTLFHFWYLFPWRKSEVGSRK